MGIRRAGWNQDGALLGRRAEDGCDYENMADLSLKKTSPDSVVANRDDHELYTAPVGSYKANPWGLKDILGNVAEWVEDCYTANYDNARKDGIAATTDDCGSRVVRGGSWLNFPRFLRAAYRNDFTPDYRIDRIGFRVARTVAP